MPLTPSLEGLRFIGCYATRTKNACLKLLQGSFLFRLLSFDRRLRLPVIIDIKGNFLAFNSILMLGGSTLVGLMLTGCGSPDRVMTLTQSPKTATLEPLNLNLKGEVGDVTHFDAPIKKDGKPYGSIMGTMTKVGSLGAGSRPDLEERMLTAVFDLPSGQIGVLGVSFYRKDAILLDTEMPMTRAIVGGTGKYVGVDGEVVTTHNGNGSYTHILKINK